MTHTKKKRQIFVDWLEYEKRIGQKVSEKNKKENGFGLLVI